MSTSDTAAAGRSEVPGPSDNSDPLTRREAQRAVVWLSVASAFALTWYLSEPILLIVGGLVLAAMLDGGTRLLGRILPIGRGWRLAIVCLFVVALLVGTVIFAGASIAGQFDMLRQTVTQSAGHMLDWAHSKGFVTNSSQISKVGEQLMGSIGKLTSAVGSAVGALSSLAMILVLGVFIATEPKLYGRGLAWMFPLDHRARFYETSAKLGFTLRRLMFGRLIGMTVEGVFVGVALSIIGVPMAVLLGILTGLLAFLPNIGAIISGVLIVLVGFSQGANTGFLAAGVYAAVQMLDGYLIVPMVARRAVDLAPALVLGAQLILGALFGILGLALADPIVAMIKVLLEERSDAAAEQEAAR